MLLARESNLPPWRELLMGFRRLEDRGEIRGGRFVDGFLGEQFALPVAVESVRAMRGLPLSGETVTLSAADPLNLVGILVPGRECRRFRAGTVSYRDGVAVSARDHRSRLGGGRRASSYGIKALWLKLLALRENSNTQKKSEAR
jgi:hypothetical protein